MMRVGDLDVSRETYEDLERFAKLVEKWTPKINLISKSSIPHLWDRHIVDSVQIFATAALQGHWVDLGSGGGFPGIVAAILSKGAANTQHFTLVESDQRKCAFLRTAIRELSLTAKVRTDRIEALPSLEANIVSARALADLSTLIGFASQHLVHDGIAIFPKGETWRKEHEDAQKMWSYACEPTKSTTNAAAAVLKIQDIARV